MKFLSLFLLFFVISCGNKSKTADENKLTGSPEPKVTIYYFHLTNRCTTCRSIEANLISAIDTYFAREKQNGELKLEIINVDDPANKALSEKFQAYGSSLHLVSSVDGKENDNDLTNMAFSYSLRQPEIFKSIMKENIEAKLK